MKLPHIVELVTSHPWMITPAGYASVKRVLDAKLAGVDLASGLRDFDGTEMTALVDNNRIAQVMVSGVLGQRISMIDRICGGADYLDLEAVTNEAIADGARGILYQFDSPGGMACGAPEAASFIASVEVPKVAFTDSMMCSAAYFLASGCDHLVATPTADVGSIGCIIPWVDSSRMWEMSGLKYDPIVSEGDSLKGAAGGPSLTPEQRDYLQASVNDMGSMFKGHVSKFRTLDYAELKAGSYNGARAKELNLVDRIGTYADAYHNLLARVDKKGSRK